MFHTRVQGEGETIDSFTTDLRLKSQLCEFGSLQDSLIRDRVVVGIRDSKIRGKVTQRLRANVRAGNRHLQSKRKVCTVKENGEIKKEYLDIFKGLGCLEGTCKMHLRQNYIPSVYPARKVPPSQKQ